MLFKETLRTVRRDEMVDITRQVASRVAQSGMQEGVVIVYCTHTTAGITINENADPDVKLERSHAIE
ncbi:secondary thiamine-phosphate synthase enzyme [Cohnella lupini]|uniref:Secondary thiamine-phosphate synthase enzyme n=1 Tax=Cohnella lupini TaxID=1294267 RepID=A0A3D9HZC1_9BACL|nr:secondary thiamine-phosphate synthase enzyme [Cohnella lupini]